MLSSKHIKTLLEEFISGTISQEDQSELFDFVNNHEVDSTIIAWLYMKWDESSKRSTGFFSQGSYDKIRKNLNLPAKSSKEERDYVNQVIEIEKRKNRRFMPQILIIAAVFIVAAIGSYFTLRNSDLSGTIEEESYTEVRIENGSKSTIVLPDSSIIILNSGSYIRYPDHFKGKNRQVLFEGEAFFNVKTGQPFPFYVNTGNISIKVTGTEFNLKSLPDDPYIETTLISGSIIIEELDHEKHLKQQVVLGPNQFAVYNKSTKKMEVSDFNIKEEIIPVQAIRVHDESVVFKSQQINTAWKDDKFVFYNESLDMLSKRMERWFNVKIEILDEDLKDFRFSGTFQNENIEQALDALKLASAFEFQVDMDHVTIKR